MADGAAGRWFFPARVFDRFKADQVIGTFDASLRGVALYDLNGDAQLDVYGCSEAGDRVYLRTGPLTFADRTRELGLAGAASRSVGVADADADGRPDLLLDNVIWQQTPQQTFCKTSWLPLMPEAALHASFADVNRDGCVTHLEYSNWVTYLANNAPQYLGAGQAAAPAQAFGANPYPAQAGNSAANAAAATAAAAALNNQQGTAGDAQAVGNAVQGLMGLIGR